MLLFVCSLPGVISLTNYFRSENWEQYDVMRVGLGTTRMTSLSEEQNIRIVAPDFRTKWRMVGRIITVPRVLTRKVLYFLNSFPVAFSARPEPWSGVWVSCFWSVRMSRDDHSWLVLVHMFVSGLANVLYVVFRAFLQRVQECLFFVVFATERYLSQFMQFFSW